MQPVEPARVPHQLLVSLDTTECDQSAAARLFRRPAGSDVLLHLQPDVELELLVQLTFHLVTPHYRAHPLDPPAQPHHGFLTLCGAENLLDQRDVLPPALRFLTECPPPRARELVVTGPTVLIRGPPLAVDPPLLFEPLQRRIQRPLPHSQRVVRDLLQPLRDRPTVQRPQRQHFQDQQIERATHHIMRRLGCSRWHSAPPAGVLSVFDTSIGRVLSEVNNSTLRATRHHATRDAPPRSPCGCRRIQRVTAPVRDSCGGRAHRQ